MLEIAKSKTRRKVKSQKRLAPRGELIAIDGRLGKVERRRRQINLVAHQHLPFAAAALRPQIVEQVAKRPRDQIAADHDGGEEEVAESGVELGGRHLVLVARQQADAASKLAAQDRLAVDDGGGRLGETEARSGGRAQLVGHRGEGEGGAPVGELKRDPGGVHELTALE